MTLLNKIASNIKFRWRIFHSSPFYIKNKRLYGFRAVLQPYVNLPIWIITITGAKVKLQNDKVDEYILRDIYSTYEKIYFPDGIELKKGDLVLDVGGHHGLYAIEVASRYPGVRVLCIEPDHDACSIIQMHINKNKYKDYIKLIPFAIGEKERTAFLVDNDDGSWGKTVELTNSDKAIIINLKTLSSILGEEKNIKLVKSNCEGGEFELIPQIIRLGLKPSFIILMIHPDRGNAEELVESLKAYGYLATIVWENKVNPCWHFKLIEKK